MSGSACAARRNTGLSHRSKCAGTVHTHRSCKSPSVDDLGRSHFGPVAFPNPQNLGIAAGINNSPTLIPVNPLPAIRHSVFSRAKGELFILCVGDECRGGISEASTALPRPPLQLTPPAVENRWGTTEKAWRLWFPSPSSPSPRDKAACLSGMLLHTDWNVRQKPAR